MPPPISHRGSQLAAVNITGLTLAVIVTSLRCYVRGRMLKAFGVDDWLMLAATICFAMYCSFSLTGVVNGTGHLRANLTWEDESRARKFWWLCYPSYAVTMTLAKISIACFFNRITVKRVHRWILLIATVVTFVSCCVFFFACIFQCWPVSYFWDKKNQTGRCIPDRIIIALAMLFSCINLITDMTFALMPAWILSHLKMKLKTKLALMFLMGMGCIASAAVVVRMPYLRFIDSEEFLHDSFGVAIWSTVEESLAITAGCLATLQPLVKLVAERLGLRTTRPSLPYEQGGYVNSARGDRAVINVRTSVTHRTEAYIMEDTSDTKLNKPLPPKPLGVTSYTAAGYSTSEEHLRLDPESGIDADQEQGTRVEIRKIPPAARKY